MAEHSRIFKFLLLGSLYFAQFLPFAFFISSLPVILRRQGYSLEDISFLYALGLPYALKFLWAPYIDRGAGKHNHYKNRVLFFTLMYSVCNLGALFFPPESGKFIYLFILTALGLFFLSTQDIAVDAIATRILEPDERGVGNGLQAAGAFTGYFVGGGILLITYDALGWSRTILLLSLLLMLSLLPLLFLKEYPQKEISRASFSSIITFFRRKEIRITVLLAVLCGIPLQTAYHKFKPFLADHGFSNEQIGFYIGLAGMASGILVSVLTGLVMRRFGMSKGFLSVLIFTALAIFVLIIPTLGHRNPIFIWAAVTTGGGMSGAVHAAAYAFYMRHAREGTEGSDFTLQNAISFLLGSMLMPIGGMLGDRYGYTVLFSVAFTMQIILLLFSFRYFYGKSKP